ncbi:MAG: preprotein translocase subunit YajC [Candidatus Omnitrophica bacterium]|nr:preprotein translocase subunit YajC [Candidatus Omnitrophota bacterium]
MIFLGLSALMALAPPSGQHGQSNLPGWVNFVPIILIFVVFYLALIRPQQKKAKEHVELIKTLRPGDKVLTNGGIMGVVVGIKEKSVSIRSADTKLEVLKSAVTEITERSGNGGESQS